MICVDLWLLKQSNFGLWNTIVAASNDVENTIKNLNQKELREYGAEMKIEWDFSTPDGPWRNGCSKPWIKSIKKAISFATDKQVFKFSELQTVCFEAPNLVNERSIGRHPTNPEDGAYLNSNHLLLGQATSRTEASPLKEPVNLRQ